VATTSELCAQILAWQERYPDPDASAEKNAESRAAEDSWLVGFAGLDTLDRSQVEELINWKFQSMPHRRAQAKKGITTKRWNGQEGFPGAGELIRHALTSDDDYQALAITAVTGGGIYRFGPAMGSVLLAACRPDKFTVADTRALKALRKLELMPTGSPSFQMNDWLRYLHVCRELAACCHTSLRGVDRALWVAGG
jgi:hypothetical protein